MGGLGSFNFRPPHPSNRDWDWDGTGSDQFQACVQEALIHCLSLWIHSHREALSAASDDEQMAFLLRAPVMPKRLKALQSDFPVKPLAPTSMGRHLARHPRPHHSTSSAYFSLFLSLAFSILSSQGTVSSGIMTCLDVMYSGNFCFFPGPPLAASPWLFQEGQSGFFLQGGGCTPALTKGMARVGDCRRLLWSMAALIDSATAFSSRS